MKILDAFMFSNELDLLESPLAPPAVFKGAV